jgi:uncharacterized protein involved in exopolysaccharide biosynthesis
LNAESPTLPAAYAARTISPKQLWAMLWAHRVRIAAAALGMAVMAGVLSKFVLPKSYYSEAALLIDYDVNNPISGREFPSMLASSYMSTQQAIIESPRVLGAVVDKLGWASHPEYAKGAADPGKLRDWIIQKVLGKNLSVKAYKDTRLIYIGYTAKDANEAARVVNTVAEVYQSQQSAVSDGSAKGRVEEYYGQLETLRQKVVDAQGKLAEFRSRTGLLEFEPTGGIEAERLSALNSRLSDLEVQRRSAEARAAVGSLAQDAEVLGSGLIQTLKARVLELQNNFTQISRDLGPRHPDYIAAAKQLEAARQALAAEEANYARSIRNLSRSAGSSEAAIAKEVNAQRQRLLATREQQDEGATLVRDVEAAKKVYERALELYDKVVAPSESSFTNIALISAGTPAIKPSKPVVRVNVLLGLVGGGLLASLAALLWELTHLRVRTEEYVSDELGLPILASIGPLT